IIASLLVISVYVALRFEWKFAVPVLIALAHDLLITAGVYSLTGREVTSATVAALLTILGYSLYDTIIVFDRVRENIPRVPRAPAAHRGGPRVRPRVRGRRGGRGSGRQEAAAHRQDHHPRAGDRLGGRVRADEARPGDRARGARAADVDPDQGPAEAEAGQGRAQA